MKFIFFLVYLTPLFISCSTDAFSDDIQKGFDMSGQEKSCRPISPNTICTMVFTASDEYGSKCQQAGYKATQCACHDYICSHKLSASFIGYDLNGQKRSCPKKTIKGCSRILTESDRFQSECTRRGYKSYACDCHDHLCSEKFEWKNK